MALVGYARVSSVGQSLDVQLFNMLGAIAQFETEIRAERQLDGINKAKQKGVKFGAQRKLTDEQIKELKSKRATG